MRHTLTCITFMLLLAACRPREEIVVLPTTTSLDAAATQSVLTREAPPVGFDTVSFAAIDANIQALDGWRYTMTFAFDGTFARTPREVSAKTDASVSWNGVQQSRHVEATISNTMQAQALPFVLDAVRLAEDAFLVRDGICLTDRPQDAETATELSAGNVLGGVQTAQVAGQRAVLNGEQVWLYIFTPESLVLPAIQQIDGSRIVGMTGELWVSPARNAVVRYYLNLDVENVLLLGNPLPVTGSLLLRYDWAIETPAPNISVPFGC